MNKELFSVIVPTLNEAEHIDKLIMSIYKQNYRPIEVIIVDDGSRDGTIGIVRNLFDKMNKNFQLILLETKNYGLDRGPAAARNIGIKESFGDFIYLADADFLFIQQDSLSNIAEFLKEKPVVALKLKVIVDNWLEYNQVIDYGSKQYHGNSYAYTREVIKNLQFDSKLGVGEDKDLIHRLGEQGLLNNEIMIKNTVVGLHYPHSLKKYRIERFWQGKSLWSYVKKYPKIDNYSIIFIRSSTFIILVLSSICFFINFLLGLTLFNIYLLILIYLYVKSPIRNWCRLLYLLLRTTYGSLWFTLGFLKGLMDLLLGKYHPGRDY